MRPTTWRSCSPSPVSTKVSTPPPLHALAHIRLLKGQFVPPGVQSVGGLEKKNIAAFIKWVTTDVEKEGKDELAASGLTWKQVSPLISQKAREWFLAQTGAK